jgi:hypothetical protein
MVYAFRCFCVENKFYRRYIALFHSKNNFPYIVQYTFHYLISVSMLSQDLKKFSALQGSGARAPKVFFETHRQMMEEGEMRVEFLMPIDLFDKVFRAVFF